jgi:FKBP-type peptidyl-prolyl cis-trans isomerase FkpA
MRSRYLSRGAIGLAVAAVALSAPVVGGLGPCLHGAAWAQQPQKARKTAPSDAARSGTATLVGVVEAPSGESPLSATTAVPISVRNGDTVLRIVVNVEETATLPRTSASHYEAPLAGDELRLALEKPGRTVKVTYVVEPLPGTEAHLAKSIEIGDAPRTGTPAPGLKYEDMVVGLGKLAERGDGVTVNYTGWLKGGEKFDSSHDRGAPMEFLLGAGKVIRGWELGVAGMREGGKRKLTIGPGLAYGSAGTARIPPNATLIFEVELLKVN